MQNKKSNSNIRKNAYYAILLFGIISLMGDIVYEGARGLIPSYLEFLGATAFIVGFVGGLGDFLGYAFRLISGFLVDTTRAYWLFIFLGYGLIAAIPLLGVPSGLEIVIILVLMERLGKAFRSPSRDTVLSIISKDVGAGRAFGIHELLDQIGGILGPSIMTFLMFSTGNYNLSFSVLAIPFMALVAVLIYTYKKVGTKAFQAKTEKPEKSQGKLPKPFLIYTFAVLLNTSGLVPYTIILFKTSEILQTPESTWIVPLIYLLIQGVDAPVALAAGFAYDKFGTKILVMPFLLSIFSSLVTMGSKNLLTIMAAALVFGIVLGMQESVYRAAVSAYTPIASRGTAYGIFNTAYGVGFLISGSLYGLLTDLKVSLILTAIYTVLTQTTATTLLITSSKHKS